MIKLTHPQLQGLKYFAYLTLPKEERKALRVEKKNPHYPDPRVIRALKLLSLVDGPAWGTESITDLGRSVLEGK